MPNYVSKALAQLNHPTPTRPQYAPHKWIKPTYGQKDQYAQQPDDTVKLPPKG